MKSLKNTNFKNVIKNPFAKRTLASVFYCFLSFGIMLLIWVIAFAVEDNPVLLPSVDIVFARFFDLFMLDNFWISVGRSLLSTLAAFGSALVAAFLLSALASINKAIYKVIYPMLAILRAVPTMAVILILLIWVDYQAAPIIIAFLIAFPIMFSSLYSAIIGIDKDLVEMTKVYNVSPKDRIQNLYIPQIAHTTFDMSSSTISLTLKIVIASEVLANTKDTIGSGMQFANLSFDVANLLAWTVLAIILSFCLEISVVILKKLWGVWICRN